MQLQRLLNATLRYDPTPATKGLETPEPSIAEPVNIAEPADKEAAKSPVKCRRAYGAWLCNCESCAAIRNTRLIEATQPRTR